MNKKTLNITRFVLITGVVFFLFGFANIRNNERPILATEIKFLAKPELFFLNQEMVNNLLIQYNFGSNFVSKDELDLKKLEGFLDDHVNVEKSEVSVSVDGVFRVVIQQKKPLVRVVNEDFSYYIDSKGEVFPLSEYYADRVPILVGEIADEDWESCLSFFKLLDEDVFLKKNVIGISVDERGELSLKNRNFKYTVYLGRPEDLEQKILNYKAFFKKAIQDSTISKYRSINLKYAQQVVCAQ